MVFNTVEGFLSGARPGDAVCLILDVDLKGTSEIKFGAPIDPFRNFAPGHIHDRIRAKPLTRPALEAGCVAYLRKPFPSSLLIGAIEQIVGHNMAARQTASSSTTVGLPGGGADRQLESFAGRAREDLAAARGATGGFPQIRFVNAPLLAKDSVSRRLLDAAVGAKNELGVLSMSAYGP